MTTIPLEREEAMATGATPDEPSQSRPPSDVLLVEDNFIIAMDVESMLQEIGVEIIRTASSVTQALEMIAVQAPAFGLLDVNVGSEKSFQIADLLRELRVPFAFVTGYGDRNAFPAQFADTPIVRKPYTLDSLRDALLG